MQRLLSSLGWCLALALATGCGNSDSGSGGEGGSAGNAQLAAATPKGPVSSTDESRDLGSLSNDESQKYCKDISAFYASTVDEVEAKKVSCAVIALLALSLGGTSDKAQLACQNAFLNCVNKPAPDPTTQDDGCSHTKINTCKGVTVGEYDVCVREQVGLTRVAYTNFASLSAQQICTPGAATGGTSTASNDLPPSCIPLEAKCPQLFESSSTTNSGGGAAGASGQAGAAGQSGSGQSGAGGAKAGAGGAGMGGAGQGGAAGNGGQGGA